MVQKLGSTFQLLWHRVHFACGLLGVFLLRLLDWLSIVVVESDLMTNERKNITQPADWWVAFEAQAKAEGKSLAAWMGEKCKEGLPAKVAKKLTERPAANRPKKKEG